MANQKIIKQKRFSILIILECDNYKINNVNHLEGNTRRIKLLVLLRN